MTWTAITNTIDYEEGNALSTGYEFITGIIDNNCMVVFQNMNKSLVYDHMSFIELDS